jgi:hypothetical protein
MRHAGLTALALLGYLALISPVRAQPSENQYYALAGQLGKVEYQYYDRGVHDPQFPGLTSFVLSYNRVKWSYDYRFEERSGERWLVVNVTIKPEFNVEVKHEMRLPRPSSENDRGFNSVRRHEFDHVAISADERPRLLLRHLFEHIGKIEKQIDPSTKVTAQLIDTQIEEQLKVRHKAIVEVIKANYVLLDKASAHGTMPLPDRAAFFKALYEKKRLAELKFEYLDEVSDLLKSLKYRQHVAPYQK